MVDEDAACGRLLIGATTMKGRDAGAACCRVLLLLLLLGNSPPAATAQQAAGNTSAVCPGLQLGVCTAACQLATCAALTDFYNSTFNPDKPW